MHRLTRPLKRYGQHFLNDPAVVDRIVSLVEPDPGDMVLEIGPGKGALTQRLFEHVGPLTVVEIDTRLAVALQERFEIHGIHVITADILEVDFAKLLQNAGKKLLYVIGNLPYNITAPLLFKLLGQTNLVNKALLMMQREVADRLTAPPGTKSYGVLSVLLGLHADMHTRIRVNPRSFRPIPKVESTVVEIDFLPKQRFAINDVDTLHRLVRTCFGQRRKMLRNSLLGMTANIDLSLGEIVAPTDIALSRRPETLSLDEFAKLANAFAAALGKTSRAAAHEEC